MAWCTPMGVYANLRRLYMTRLIGLLVLALAASTACTAAVAGPAYSTEPHGAATAPALRLGYFPNVTHAPAIVAFKSGALASALAAGTTLTTTPFDTGTTASEALLSDSIDATFIGPNPAINAFQKSQGQAIRIISGATSGGAFLVVKPEITDAEELRGRKIASPSLGNTQDVALRAWLKSNGMTTTKEGAGDVSVVPQQNSQTLETFIAGEIDGAWVPEPWATRLIDEGGGKVLVDERDLWPDGRYVTTHLIVRTDYLQKYPGTIKALIEAELAAQQLIASDPAKAQALVNEQIKADTGKAIGQELLETSWGNLEFTMDPIASSLEKSAQDAVALELLEPVDLTRIYDVTILNQVLADAGETEVSVE
jgi:NitT/TauT family transport system substrate-binding protein